MEVSSKQNITTQKATSKKGGLRTVPFIIGDCLLRSFLGQNGPIPFIFEIFSNKTLFQKLLCFGNYWRSTTFSDTRAWWARVLYFLIHCGTMTWKAGIKIFCLVLEHLKLEYCWTVLESYKLEYRLFIYCTPLKWTDGCLAGNH